MQPNQSCMHNKTYDNTKSAQKTKASFCRLLRHAAWKRNGPILKKVDK